MPSKHTQLRTSEPFTHCTAFTEVRKRQPGCAWQPVRPFTTNAGPAGGRIGSALHHCRRCADRICAATWSTSNSTCMTFCPTPQLCDQCRSGGDRPVHRPARCAEHSVDSSGSTQKYTSNMTRSFRPYLPEGLVLPTGSQRVASIVLTGRQRDAISVLPALPYYR